MFVLSKVKYLSSSINTITKCLSSTALSFHNNGVKRLVDIWKVKLFPSSISALHTSSKRYDLMEFFESKENWGTREIKVGRAWKKEELRIKSNSDLHKLWFVLLKERNMLLTMEHEAKERVLLFPNPERLDKVEESMENLECVVRERNRAYFKLETGESGEREIVKSISPLGLNIAHKTREYSIPKFINTSWVKKHHKKVYRGHAVRKFLRLYREKLSVDKRKLKNRDRNHVQHLLRRFPHIEKEVLETHYPDVDISKAMSNKKSLGHHEYNKG